MEPGVSTVLGGFSDAEQVEEIAAASEAGPLSPEELEQVHAVWRTNFSN
jgi:hypothetical protein